MRLVKKTIPVTAGAEDQKALLQAFNAKGNEGLVNALLLHREECLHLCRVDRNPDSRHPLPLYALLDSDLNCTRRPGPRRLPGRATTPPRRAEACLPRRDTPEKATASTTVPVGCGRHTKAAFGPSRADAQ